jgi:hypothetical protein
MRRTTLIRAIAALAAAALAMPALAAKPPKPPKRGPLSIGASPAAVIFGGSTAISGRLTGKGHGGVSVTLAEKRAPFTGPFRDVGTTTTNSKGDYSFRVAPRVNTRYRARSASAPPRTSAELFVPVRIRVGLRVSDSTPRSGARVLFAGSAAPAHDGRVAKVQRRTSTGAYRTVARTTLGDAGDARSRYTRRVPIRRDGVYRVQVPADADHATGVSAPRRINVH